MGFLGFAYCCGVGVIYSSGFLGVWLWWLGWLFWVFCALGFVVVCICVWVSGLASFGFLGFGIFGVVWGFDLWLFGFALLWD